jgi:hypothetical protein
LIITYPPVQNGARQSTFRAQVRGHNSRGERPSRAKQSCPFFKKESLISMYERSALNV